MPPGYNWRIQRIYIRVNQRMMISVKWKSHRKFVHKIGTGWIFVFSYLACSFPRYPAFYFAEMKVAGSFVFKKPTTSWNFLNCAKKGRVTCTNNKGENNFVAMCMVQIFFFSSSSVRLLLCIVCMYHYFFLLSKWLLFGLLLGLDGEMLILCYC